MSALTPMMQAYTDTKKKYEDCILFYRLGDFYEMFFDDALTASKELELTLTGKSCGLDEKAPMCGVPYHSAEVYIARLVQKGYKVAVCEQMEDPKLVRDKDILKREVVRIVTPGTNLITESLDASKNNYLCCVAKSGDTYGLATVDATTGDFLTTVFSDPIKLTDEIIRYAPSELICDERIAGDTSVRDRVSSSLNITAFQAEGVHFDRDVCERTLKEHFNVTSLDALGLTGADAAVVASGALLQYLSETQMNSLSQITGVRMYTDGKYMLLDAATCRNLELTETIREKQKKGSLIWVLDKTKTAMGARMLRSMILRPLCDLSEIGRRLDAVRELKDNAIIREEIRGYLAPVYDMERLVGRIAYQSAGPRDLIAFKTSLEMLSPVKCVMEDLSAPLLTDLNRELDDLSDIKDLISSALDDDPPVGVREGGIIRAGYNGEVDRLRSLKTDGKAWIAKLEEEERKKTGIKNLRVRYSKVFGYCLEVTNSFKDQVPDYYIRKQTLVGAERYVTPKLKELEDSILGAQDKLYALEYELFTDIRERIAKQAARIQKTAKIVACVDVLTSLAFVAERYGYVKPKVHDKGVINIKGGRHPVVERMAPADMFIANDTHLDYTDNRVAIITGPNMAGKSTYMRQTALIVLMAQIGSFVPATDAEIGIADRIFTRVGASDDLAGGQSTFMVEMSEVANILRNATSRSLLILDEIGRGTGTYDGLSIAWAVVEHISDKKLLGARALFATHYHELTELEGKLDGVHNYCILVKEKGEDIVFLRKIAKGGADKSYGIQVARLAGVPKSVIKRAGEIAARLQKADVTADMRAIFSGDDTSDASQTGASSDENVAVYEKNIFKSDTDEREEKMTGQTSDMSTKEESVIKELKDVDISAITPLEALNILYRLQGEL